LQAAAQGLGKNLTKNPHMALPFVLASSNPDVSEDDPSIVSSLEALEAVWKTYRNAFQETPILVARGILLEALVGAMSSNDHIALIVASCVRNLIPHREMGSEQEVWSRVLFTAESKVDKRATKDWETPTQIELPKFKFPEIEPPKLVNEPVSIETKALKIECAETVSNQVLVNGAAQSLENGNPFNLHNQKPHFAEAFGTKMAEVLATTISSAIESSESDEIDLARPFERIADELSSILTQSFQAYSAATSGLERRTNLLWWKEALFSKSIGDTYRSLEPKVAPALMALDLFKELPCFAPASVTAFLHETVLKLPLLDGSEKHSLAELLNAASKESKLAPLRKTLDSLIPEEADSKLLISFLSETSGTDGFDQATVVKALGVSTDTELTLPDWASWLLGDLMVLRAAALTRTNKRRKKAA